MTIVEAPPGITGGVDTHLDVHVAAALDPLGRLIGTESFSTDTAGYRALLEWLRNFGEVTKVGVEGTGSYGAGLARFLRREHVHVVEVNRPDRQARRNPGKTDALDAVEAALAALSGKAKGHAKTRDGASEAIRTLIVAKRSARQSRVKAKLSASPRSWHRQVPSLSAKCGLGNGDGSGATALAEAPKAEVVQQPVQQAIVVVRCTAYAGGDMRARDVREDVPAATSTI